GEWAEVTPRRRHGGSVGGPELDEEHADDGLHPLILGARPPSSLAQDRRREHCGRSRLGGEGRQAASGEGRPAYFFLHAGPSLGSCFSVMCASPPASFSAADFSAFMGVYCVHWGGTLASA